MNDTIVAVYAVCDDMLTGLRHRNDPQCHLTDAEVMTIAITAARFFGGNLVLTCCFMAEHGYMHHVLGPSRFSRRLHRIKHLFLTLFHVFGDYWKDLNTESVYIIDSFPLPSCDNIRIRRSRRYRGEEYRGFIASKRRYFYGLRLHLMVTPCGKPIEFFLTPGEDSDTGGMCWYQFEVPAGSTIIGDKGFNNYSLEDEYAELDIKIAPLRKKNSKRAIPPWETYVRSLTRKYIETTGSCITRRFPKSIHAVTAAGFELKIVLFLLAYSFDCL